MKRYHVFIILIFSLVLAINIISNNKELDNWNHEGNVRFSNSTFVVSTTDKNFVHKEVAGDKTIIARVFDASNNAAAGLELRERDTDRLVSFISSDNEDVYLRLVKTGNIVRQYKSKDGKAWELVDETSIPKLSDNLYLGMVVSSKDSKKKAQAKFKNVSIDDTNNLRTLCSETIGDVRIQILSPTVVRIEQKGPKGFEDRNTFHIEQRDWIGASYKKETKGNHVHLSFDEFVIKVRKDAKSIYNVSIYKKDDTLLWEYSNESNSKWLPGPSENTEVWSIIDKPRVVPSEHGFIPQEKEIENNGWDLNNDADDVYVFLPKGEYRTLRLDFINLTGRTDMIPMYALGNWESKYYPYSDKTALDRIEAFRKRSIPLDVLVIDTDWRVGGSDGYIINTELFPDVESFFNNAHEKNVKVMFNDHPGSVGAPLTKQELEFRTNGLGLLLEKGLDIWWYDRNWHTSIEPLPGINKEVWGMEIYRNITSYYKGNLRPLILANFDGIDNGKLNRAPNIAAHRYPIQWTGDTFSNMLKEAIENMVYVGVHAPFPYLAEDLGGHFDEISTELFVRWMQFGALSPIYRVHSANQTREPWMFGKEAENIVRDYLNMRYRLIPLMYTLSKHNYDTGEPIFRRLDLVYPQYEEAKRNNQYLLGDSILIAPIYENIGDQPIPKDWLETSDGKPGLKAEYFNNNSLKDNPVLTRIDSQIDFNWGTNSPHKDVRNNSFTARWTGKITVKGNYDVNLAVMSDDGVRIWINDELTLDKWEPQNAVLNVADFVLEKGKTYDIKVEYLEIEGNARITVYALPVEEIGTQRELWLPPGKWIDAWTGEVHEGDKTLTKIVSLRETPMYIKLGTIIPLAPEMQYTSEKPHDPITLDIYPDTNGAVTQELYEDDTITNAYKRGEYRKTYFSLKVDESSKSMDINISKAEGDFEGSLQERGYVIRIRKPLGWEGLDISKVTVDGSDEEVRVIPKNTDSMPYANEGSSPDNDVIEIVLAKKPVYEERNVKIVFV